MAVGLVPDVGYTVQFLFPGEAGDLFDQVGLVHLVGDLGDDYLFPVSAARDLFNLGGGLHDDAAAPGGVGVEDALVAQDIGARWEIGAFDRPHQLFCGGVRVVDQADNGVADLSQVVGRDVGGHTHGDARRAVDQHVGQAGRQDGWLSQRVVEVWGEIDGVLVDIRQQFLCDGGQTGFGVPHGCRRVAVDAAEVTLTSDQRVTQ